MKAISYVCNDHSKYCTKLMAREGNGGQQPVQRAAGYNEKHAMCMMMNDRQCATTTQHQQVMCKACSEWLITSLQMEQMEGMEWECWYFFASKVGAKWHNILTHSKKYYSKNYWRNRNASALCQKWEQSDTKHCCIQKFITPKTTSMRGFTPKTQYLRKVLLGKLSSIIHIKKYISTRVKFYCWTSTRYVNYV